MNIQHVFWKTFSHKVIKHNLQYCLMYIECILRWETLSGCRAGSVIDLIPKPHSHYNDVIMSVKASQITNLTIVYSTVYTGADQRKHQSSTSLAFARGIHRSPVNSPHKGPVTRKMFPFDDVIMTWNTSSWDKYTTRISHSSIRSSN